MSDPDGFFASRRVAIVGLGLMGGSMALALRGQVAELWAADPAPATRALARERRVVERVVADPGEIIPQADVIILAAPVQAIMAQIRQMSHWPKRADAPINRQIVLDLGSTKREIVAAMEALPPQFDPLGGHPMCGKETSGMAHADPEIYHSATFAFTPLTRTSPQGRAFAEMLATAVGAKPLWIDAQTHDRWVATTSHLPYLLASSLAGATPKEVAPLIGPGYRSASRLAAASPSIMLDILQTNRQPVLEALRCFRSQIERVEALLAEPDFTALSDLLMTTAQHHANLMQSAQES